MSREGNLEAPTRHALDWQNPDFYNEGTLNHELERILDICHGYRRCVSLCNSFPTLFDLVDNSATMEADGIDKKDFMQVLASSEPDYISSDCQLAGHHIEQIMDENNFKKGKLPHLLTLARTVYCID